jgi:predicted membrane GTPase involved in stress response
LQGKKLTNIRAAGNDEAVRLPPPRVFSLEDAVVYVAPDELVEVCCMVAASVCPPVTCMQSRV